MTRNSPLEELTSQHAEEGIAKLEGKLDLNQRQIRAALSILGENDIPPERLAAKLVEIAERFKDLQATASAQPGDRSQHRHPERMRRRKPSKPANWQKRMHLLADVETEQRRTLDRLAVNAAETSARRGEIALARLRYTEAAKHFANAAGVFPPNSEYEDKRISYLQKEASALFQQGDEFGDNGALLSAIERYKRLVDLAPRERVPLDWARIQDRIWALRLLIFGRARKRDGEARRGRRRLSRGVEGKDPRAGAARLGR